MNNNWKFWNGEQLQSPLAIDTETTIVDLDREIPQLVLASVYDGTSSYILKPQDVGYFIHKHSTSEFIFHNASFDFWVIANWLSPSYIEVVKRGLDLGPEASLREASRLWWDAVSSNRFHDTMLLDRLVRIANGDGEAGGEGVESRALDLVTAKYARECPLPDKSSPYRTKFGELLNSNWALVDPGYFDYASLDAIATWHCYQGLKVEALKLSQQFSHRFHPNAIERWGVLTESIQIQAAISLSAQTRLGIAVDKEAAKWEELEVRCMVDEHYDWLVENYPQIFKWRKDGDYERTKKGEVPALKWKEIQVILSQIAKDCGFKIPRSSGKTKAISKKEVDWVEYVDRHPFIEHWVGPIRKKKLLEFFALFKEATDGRLHPHYDVVKKTGRVGAYSPNIQQIPTAGKGKIGRNDFRSLFVAAPGYKLLTIDYSAIELRTLAATCEHLFGHSRLGQVIREGADPHAFTAAMMLGKSTDRDSLEAWKKEEPARFKEMRQAAKACFSGDTELLTEDGWRCIDEAITDCSLVAQYDPHSNEISFVTPLAWVKNEDSEFVEIDSTFMNQCVTLDHRMLLVGKSSGVVREIQAWEYEDVGEAWCTVHGGFYYSDVVNNKLRTRLSVMVQADGNFSGNWVRLGFKKTRKIDRCRALLRAAGVEYVESRFGDVTTFIAEGSEWFDLTETKHFYDWTSYDHEAFIEEIGLWDGCVTEKHAASYCNTSKGDCDVVQTILALNGYKAVMYKEEGKNSNCRDVYKLRWYVGDRKKNPQYARCNKSLTSITPVVERGRSYCLSVPTSWVLTRRKGKVSVSGNCNFGIPGGLGPKKLALYAKTNYNVEMTVEQASEFRGKIINDIYPELSKYLTTTYAEDIARNTKLSLDLVEKTARRFFLKKPINTVYYLTGRVLRGLPLYANGEDYDKATIKNCEWILRTLFDEALRKDWIEQYRAVRSEKDTEKKTKMGSALLLSVFGRMAYTLTGRLRDRTDFANSSNNPFQGLASDGIKIAMFQMVKEGFRLCMTVHDEAIVEIPESRVEEGVARVYKIMEESMASVVGFNIPIALEYQVSNCWKK